MKIKLGELIEQRREKATDYTLPIYGVSRTGFIPPKQKEADLTKYNTFYLGDFVFNPARMEINSIAYNAFFEKAICSSLYEVFFVKRPDLILPEYLNLFVKRDEFARQCEYIGWGSAREYCRIGDISKIELDLPDIAIQQKYVAVYQALLANQQAYEKGLDDLKLVCDGYIEHLQKTETLQRIGDFIIEYKGKNNGKLGENDVMGIATTKNFIETKSNLDGVNLDNYLIVKQKYFAYVADTSRRNDKVSLAFNNSENSYLVSSISTVFYSKDETQLLPEYLALFFNRSEFDRYARFHSWGSAREVFAWADLCDVKIPIVDIEKQQAIVDIYKVLLDRRAINDTLKQQIKAICPVLVRGAVAEMAK